jgi:sulfofructose kinase
MNRLIDERGPAPRPARVLCVGGATLDTIFRIQALPTGPGKILPSAMSQVAAGMAASAATAVARLGGNAALWSRVGDDAVGDRVRQELADEGVDVTHVRSFKGQTAVCTVLVDGQGERLVVPYFDPAIPDSADWLPFDDLRSYAAVLADVRWPSAAQAVLSAALDNGLPAVLDAEVAPREALERLVPLASHAVFSQPGAAVLTGSHDPAASAVALARRYAGFVCVTAGERGSYWIDNGQLRHTPTPRLDVIDTLAAGDVFHGAFALALAEREVVSDAIEFASAAAALKCTRWGGRLGAPSREEVRAELRRTYGHV